MNNTKNNLFISSSALTTLIFATIIDDKFRNDNNILIIVSNHLETKFLNSMYEIAEKLGCFHRILFYNDYSAGMKINSTVTKKEALDFNFNKFEQDTGIKEYDSIYSTFFYYQAQTLINHYKSSDLNMVENGTASYIQQKIDSVIIERIKNFYSFNYWDKWVSPLVIDFPKIKQIVINKEKIKLFLQRLARDISIEEDRNSVVFCTHNLCLDSSLMSIEEEFAEYYKAINELISKGFTVYLKEHPKTPDMFYNIVRSKLHSQKIKVIKEPYPIEAIVCKLRPKAVVSVFSTSLLLVNDLFGIPCYTISMENNLSKNKIFMLAYAMVTSYIPKISDFGNTQIPTSNLQLAEEPLVQILTTSIFKNFVERRKFNTIQKYIKDVDFSRFEYFGISEELFDIYKYGSYWDFLSYYAPYYVENIKNAYSNLSRIIFYQKAIKTFISMF